MRVRVGGVIISPCLSGLGGRNLRWSLDAGRLSGRCSESSVAIAFMSVYVFVFFLFCVLSFPNFTFFLCCLLLFFSFFLFYFEIDWIVLVMTGLCLIVELLARCALIGVLVVRRRGQGAGGEGGG